MTGSGWNTVRLRAVLWQALALIAVCVFAAWLVSNTLDNMGRRGIASGFGFLDSSAGFGVTMSLIEYSEAASFGRAFLVGLLNTLLVSAAGIVLATVIGVLVGVARLSPNWLVARLAGAYVETLRNIPLLLQLFFWYFVVLRALPPPRASIDIGGLIFFNNRGVYLPAMEGGPAGWSLALLGACAVVIVFALSRPRTTRRRILPAGLIGAVLAAAAVTLTGTWQVPVLSGFNFVQGTSVIPEFVALLVALSTYTAAFIAEIVRAGIQAVPRGQIEAAQALALSRRRVLRHVVLPQALRVIVPPLTSQYLNLTKNSSLAAAIAYPDLVSVFAGTVLNITGQAVEVIALTMAVYLAISLGIAGAMNLYNRAVALRGT